MDGFDPPSVTATRTARAKINLALHVTGQQPDGYHEIESLVVFAEDGDRLRIEPAEADRLWIDGRFASNLPVDERNIVVRALHLARAVGSRRAIVVPPLAVHLTKNLPQAAGIGGGSADAAALLRWIGDAFPALASELHAASVTLGADVPMCLRGVPARVRGIGEISAPLPALPELHLVLVNPGVEVSTPAVFAALERRDNPPMPSVSEGAFVDLASLLNGLRLTRNDLEAPALRLAPIIADVMREVAGAGALLTRMSGSGATVFGLFENGTAATEAAGAIAGKQPSWWVVKTRSVATGVRE